MGEIPPGAVVAVVTASKAGEVEVENIPLSNPVSLKAGKFIVYLEGFEVFKPPLRSTSPGSQAVYLAIAGDRTEHMLLLQYLPSFTTTSRHYHDSPQIEVYHLLAGEGILEIDSREYIIFQGQSKVVWPRERHCYRTEESPALTMLEIHGNPDCLKKHNHHYV